MRIIKNRLALSMLLFFFGISIIFTAAPVSVSADVAFYENQISIYMHNSTGRTANDLELYLDGNVLVSNWWGGGVFQDLSYIYDSSSNMTIVRFHNGTVSPCQAVHTAFITNTTKLKLKYLPRWSYDGVAGPIAGAALSNDITAVNSNQVDVTFANTPKDGGPETIGIIQIGTTNTVYSLPELNWTNEALNKIPWIVQKTNVPLKPGQSITFPSIPVPDQALNIIYRTKIWLDSDPKNVVEYVGQFVPNTAVTTQH